MMAFLEIAWAYRKWVAYGVAVLAISILAWRIHAWREGYLSRAEAVAQLATEKAAHDADLSKIAQDLEQSEKARAALAVDLGNIRTRFAELAAVVPKTLIVTKEVPIRDGQTTCPVPRVSAEFVSVYNAAGSP